MCLEGGCREESNECGVESDSNSCGCTGIFEHNPEHCSRHIENKIYRCMLSFPEILKLLRTNSEVTTLARDWYNLPQRASRTPKQDVSRGLSRYK